MIERLRNIAFSCGLFIAVSLGITGCTETQFLAHMFKNTVPADSKSAGKYKVGNPYKIDGRWYYPKEEFSKVQTGVASWYGPNFHGKLTANGEVYDQNALTAAHKTLQLPAIIRVTNLDNGRSLILRVNDRGPYSRGRILDVSKRGAELLGFRRAGTAKIRLEVLDEESRYVAAQAKQGISTDGVEVALNKGRHIGDVAGLKPQTDDLSSAAESSSIGGTGDKQARLIADAAPANLNQGSLNDDEMAKTDLAGNAPINSEPPTVLKSVLAEPMPQSVQGQQELVTTVAPVKTNLFVQAGSFSSYGNAARLKTSLARLGPTDIYETQINGQTFYRVRIGPVDSVVRADTILQSLTRQGNDRAIIVVQ